MDVLVYMLLLTASIVSGEYVIHLHGNESDSNTLQYYLCSNGSLFLNSDTILALSHDVPHYLVPGPFCLVKNINNITIASNSSVKAAHIICHNDIVPTRGIGFINISGLYLYNLHIHQCGGILNTAITSNNTWLYFPIGLSAVLLFHHCNELHVSNVSIDGGYYGYAIISIDVHGETLFYNITVTDSIVCTSQQLKLVSPFCSGSGLLFLFIDESDKLQSGQSFLIKSSTISRNVNQYLWGQNPIDILQLGVQQVPVFGAGGLTILFIGSSYKNGHVVLESNDVSSNSGDIAGGCLVLYLNTISPTIPNLIFNTTPSIVNNFYNNSVTGSYRARGGGLAIYVITRTITKIETSLTITFNQIKFFNNTSGYYGGAVFIQVNCVSHIVGTIYFNKTAWFYNEATFGGSSLYIEAKKHISLTDDIYNISVVLSDIYVRARSQRYSLEKEVYNVITGSLFKFHYINSISIKQRISGNHFYCNHQAVLVAVNSSLFIQGKLQFFHYAVKISSFIRLESLSHVTFQAPAQIGFQGENNFPPTGAITALEQPYSVYTDCPLKFQPNATQNITINFPEINKGFYLIYSDGLQHCKLEHMYPLHNYLNKISSPPTGLQLCDLRTGQIMNNNTKYEINTYPGKSIKLSIIAMDFQGKPTLTKLFIYLDMAEMKGPKLILSKKAQLLHDVTCTNVSFTLLSGPYYLPQKMKQNLHFAVLEGSIQMIIPILMMPCPVGFSISHGICTCDSFITNQKIANICNIDTTSITISSGKWLGYIQNHSYGFASVCPTGYCKNDLTDIDMTQKDYICHPNRRGTLCGDCVEGYSIVLGSDDCERCHSNLFLLLIIAFVVAGIAAILILFCLSITISSKVLGGIVFFANMTEVSLRDSLTESHMYGHILNIIFSLLNLNLGFGICFFKGMTALYKTALQFVFPVYLWLIVVVLILLSRFSTRIANLTSYSSVQVLATLFYMSFAKLLLTVIDIFTPASIQTPQGDYTVWYIDGNVKYWKDTGHIILFIVAIGVTLIYLIPFLLWTTCGSLALRIRCIRHYRNFLDAYQGRYREGWGWWFGARLWLLVCAYISYALLRGKDPSLLLCLHILLLAPFTFIQIYCKPFRGHLVNVVEGFVLVNLVLMEFTALYFQLQREISKSAPYASVFMSLVLFVLLLLVGYHVLGYMKKFRMFMKMWNPLMKIMKNLRFKVTHIKQRYLDDVNIVLDNDRERWNRDFREPLLEDYSD